MALQIFPVSPLPAEMRRIFRSNANVARYDSGARQSFSAWKKPLYRWEIPFRNMNEIKQNTLSEFSKDVFGPRDPFLMKDPYDYSVGSVLLANTGTTNGSTLQTFDVRSFSIRIDTTDISTITSALSGFVTLGTEFDYDQDSGILTVNTIAATDHWSATNTIEYFRKVAFAEDYSDVSQIWNIFSANVIIEEIV